jgi:hypothetical protein
MGFFALVIAAVLVFAFSPRTRADAPSPKATTWVKYNCAVDGQVAILSGGNTSAGGYAECNGSGNICARQYNTTDLDPVPGHPGNFTPKSGATPLQTARCPE